MKHIFKPLLLLLAICFSVSLFGQKNADLKKANKQYDLHAYNLAIKSYKKVLAKETTNLEALSNIADSYRHLGQMEDAAGYYKIAIQQAGVDPVNLLNYGLTLMSLGKYEEAEEWLLTYAEGRPLFGNHYAESCQFAVSLRGVSALYRVKKEFANTESSDFGPAFFGDDVIYSSARKDMKRKMEQDNANWQGVAKNQLFLSSIDNNGFLSKPKFLLNDLKNTYNKGLVSYSADGRWVAFVNNNFVDGTRQIPSSGMEMSIYIAEATGDGSWKDAKAFPYNGSGYSSGFPHLSDDGQKLYFASNRPDGFGGYDLYVSFRTGSSWSTPENLGPVINSEGNEITPYMEEGILYFASDWHHGLGGMDIFRAVREEGIWNKVFHLGNTVNSPMDDFGFIFNSRKNKGYFVSNRKGGNGNEDIYQISKLSEDIVIRVLDAGTQTPVEGANLDFSNCGEQIYQTDAYGKYSFQAFQGLDCSVIISMSGYKSNSIKVTSGERTKSKEITVVLSKLATEDIVDTSKDKNDEKKPAPETKPTADALTGVVINATDNMPVSGVYITAISKTNGAEKKVISNENGSYQLSLALYDAYIIRYSKAGYTDTHQQIELTSSSDKNVLGVLQFIPASTNLETKIDAVTSSKPPKDKAADELASKSTEDKTDSSKPDAIGNSGSDVVPQTAQEGFSIQVAAVGLDDQIKLGKYEQLTDIGNLYGRPQNGMKKIRVGIYSTREEAVDAQKEIAAKGFKKTFVVAERLEDMIGVEMYGTQDEEKIEPAPEPAPAIDLDANGRYMVRLATYRNAHFFDGTVVSTFGNVVERMKGNMTIKLLAGYAKREDAERARLKAIESGFSGAHIVIEENGVLKKI